jgi:hypothetical protein
MHMSWGFSDVASISNAWRPQFYDMDISSMNLRHH